MSLADEFDGITSQGPPSKKPTHRGRRSRGKGPKPDAMGEANAHIDAARKDPTPQGTTAHLFKALSSLKKC